MAESSSSVPQLALQRDICDPSMSTCAVGTVGPDGQPNPGPEPSNPTDGGTATAGGPAPAVVTRTDGQPNQTTPARCDPTESSCAVGTVGPDGRPNLSTDLPSAAPSAKPGGAANDDCLADFDVTTASATDKLLKAMQCSKDTIGDEIYNNLVGSLETMAAMAIAFAVVQFIPGVDLLVDGVALIELVKIAVEAGLNYQMAAAIAGELNTFLSAAAATSNEGVKAGGAALAQAVGQSAVLVLMLLIGGAKGAKPGAGEGAPALSEGEFPAATEGKLTKVTVGEGPPAPGGEHAASGDTTSPTNKPAEGTTPLHSDTQMSDGQPVAGEATSADGAEEVKVGEDGKCEVCASPCLEIRAKYAEALKNPVLEQKLAAAEAIPDLPRRAGAIAELLPQLESASGRPGSELANLGADQAKDSAQDVSLTDVDPSQAKVLDLPEYQEGIGRASDAFARLPDIENSKNIAGTPSGAPSTSGWGEGKGGSTDRAQVEGNEAGHETNPHPFDPKDSEGRYESSHSERQQAAGSSEQEFASSKEMCPACQAWFGARAASQGRPQFVADPTGVHVFMPNGSHTVVPHPSGAITTP